MHQLGYCILSVLAWLSFSSHIQAQLRWNVSSTMSDVSLRGFSVVGQSEMWACGSNATVVRSLDGGASWTACGPKGFDKLEFRSLVAFDGLRATIASAGSPAVILATSDGGNSWSECYRHSSPAAFFDGLKFWDDSRGIAFSDPIEGRFLVVTTHDGGASWQELAVSQRPNALDKEAAFAASNSSLLVAEQGTALIGTGGAPAENSRLLRSNDYGLSWKASSCPLPSSAAAGIFSLVQSSDGRLLVAVGGDYRPEARSELTAAFSQDEGQTWKAAAQPPQQFVSAVCVLKSAGIEQFIATGPSSSFVSPDGDHWEQFSDVGFHTLAVNSSGKVFGVGSGGRFGRLVAP